MKRVTLPAPPFAALVVKLVSCELFRKGSAITEGYEMKRDLEAYRRNFWNVLDVLGVMILLFGFLVRVADYESQGGRSLYALSAPLLFSHVLFFAQVFRFQGPMIQVRVYISVLHDDRHQFATIFTPPSRSRNYRCHVCS